ncbi:MAG: alginate export family protein [Pseudomonadota bacterium]
MKTWVLAPLGAATILGASTLYAQESTDDDASSLTEMITGIDAKLNFRHRFEHVERDAFEKNANASTLRSRLTLETASYNGFVVLGEVDNVTAIGPDDYNSTENGQTQFPVVADPEGTDLNQLLVRYTHSDSGTVGTLGRQRINHSDQRFIGGVAWRQNEQTYDGLRGQWKGGDLSVDYAYVAQINRIFGPDDGVQAAQWEGQNHFLKADYKAGEKQKFSAFLYELQIDEDPNYPGNRSVNNSTRTVGVEYSGSFGPFGLAAALATQSDTGDSLQSYTAPYYKLEGSYKFSGLKASVRYEVLGGDNGVGFKTPLATLHKFQGWADKFLVTPGDGIEDLQLGLTGSVGKVKLGAFYHDFQAEDSSADFGTEIDLVATWPISKSWSLQGKYANFSSDNPDRFDDTQVAWMTIQFKL